MATGRRDGRKVLAMEERAIAISCVRRNRAHLHAAPRTVRCSGYGSNRRSDSRIITLSCAVMRHYPYMRDLLDHVRACLPREGLRDTLTSVSKPAVCGATTTRGDNRQLAAWAAILAVPMLLQVYGMNFDHMPELIGNMVFLMLGAWRQYANAVISSNVRVLRSLAELRLCGAVIETYLRSSNWRSTCRKVVWTNSRSRKQGAAQSTMCSEPAVTCAKLLINRPPRRHVSIGVAAIADRGIHHGVCSGAAWRML